MKTFIVTDNEGIVVATYAIEGHARRFCKDNGYSYEEVIPTKELEYWKERCRLVEILWEEKSDYLCGEKYFETRKLYEELIDK